MNKNSTLLHFLKAILLLFILLLGIFSNSYSQKQANVWYFGDGLGLDFNAGTIPTKLTKSFSGQHVNDVDEGHATVCDENGNFLFYTNGEQIWDKNAATMQNGTGLLGHWSATQCATIFPLPGNSKTADLAKYIVLTTPVTSSSTTGIKYNIVDMDPTTNGGYATGAVTSKNNSMTNAPTSSTEALASCPHWNGNDEWVVGHDESNQFYAWKVSSDASGNIVISNPVISPIGDNVAGVAVMKFNNCFNKLAVTVHNNSTLQVFSFDNQTGVVGNFDSNPSGVNDVLKLDVSQTANGSTGAIQGNYGIEFSPNGQYLFVSQSGQRFSVIRSQRLYRYDLKASAIPTKATIEASRTTLLDREGTDDAQRLGHLQLAPNGKIYMTHMYTFWAGDGALSVINNPDNVAHGFSLESVTWTGTRSSMGLPSFHKGFLAGSASISAADSTGTTSINDLGEICAGIATMFENKYTGTGTNYTWDVNAPNGTLPLYGTSLPIKDKAYHRYDVPGDYLIVTSVTDAACGYIVRDTATIHVNPVIKTSGSASCSNPNVTLNVNSADPLKKYVWYTDNTSSVILGTGSPLTVPITTNTNYNYYVKEVSDLTTTTGLSSTIGATTTTGTTSNATTSNTIVITQTTTLVSAKYEYADLWSGGCQYTITIKDASNAVKFSTTATIPNNSPGVKTVNFGVTLSPGTYTLTYSQSGGSNPAVLKRRTSLTNQSSISGVATVTFPSGQSPFYNFIFNYDKTDVTPLACSYAGNVAFNCPLPVKFIYVKASPDKLITWATSIEINNHYFIVERSLDGKNFLEIGKVKGAGSNNSSIYNFNDNDLSNGDVYYRIMQVDYNGTYSYSDIVAINGNNTNSISLYPNPNNGEFTISFNQTNESDVTIEVINVLGTTIYSGSMPSGKNVTTLNLSYLPKGAYFLKTSNDTSPIVSKLIVE